MPELSIGDGAPVELRLMAVSLIVRLPGPWKIFASGVDDLRLPAGTELRFAVSEGDAATIRIEGKERILRLAGRKPVLEDSEGNAPALPWVVARELFPSPESRMGEIPRILFEGEGDERRLRMTLKTIEELRRRRFPFTAISVGRIAPSMAAVAPPDEVHEELSAGEYLALVSSGTAVVECTDAYGEPSALSVVARAAGLPLVTHADRAEPAGAEGSGVAGMWSAEAFADALVQCGWERSEGFPFAEEIEAILEVLSVQ
jgi:hypothetical protein